MKRLLLLALVLSFTSTAASAETTWSGSTTWRYRIRANDDGLDTKVDGKSTSKSTIKDHQIRADLNASGKGEVWDWGVGVRTFENAGSEWLTLNSNRDVALSLENGYFRAHKSFWESDWSVTLGRAKTVLLFDTVAQTLYDKDVRWDGLGWTWKKGDFGVNASQYVLGARNLGAGGPSTFTRNESTDSVATTTSGFSMLYSLQPYVKFKLSEVIEGLVAVAYHHGSGMNGYSNTIHGGTAGTAPVVIPSAVGMDNPRQWHLFTDWTLPYNFRFLGEFVQNKKVFYGSTAIPTDVKAQGGALGLTLVYGKIKKAHDWSLSYSYVRKGIGSVITTFTNSNMKPDNIGHLIDGKYALADGLTFGTKVELYREKAKLGGTGQPVLAPNQNRRQTQNRYEFYAGVAF